MINNRQFIISKKKYKAENFRYLQLRKDYILSYHKNLKVCIESDIHEGIIIGIAWQVHSGSKNPQEQLKDIVSQEKIDVQDIYRMEESWCGRYILVLDQTVYMDAVGLLGVFYSKNSISSSYSILCDDLQIKDKYPDHTFGIAMGFQPGRFTMHKQIKRLLPSECLDISSESVMTRKLMPYSGKIEEMSVKDVKNEFIKTFQSSLKNMRSAVNGIYYVALTGGCDSRALIALLEGAGVDYKCFTLEVTGISNGDYTLPKMLADRLKRDYKFIKRNPRDFSKRRFDEYIIHSNGFAKDEDAKSYAYKQYEKLKGADEEIIILRSGLWECFKHHYRRFCKSENILVFEKIKTNYKAFEIDSYIEDSLKDYLDYLKTDNTDELTEVDRFYWEIRDGCWLSSVEQGDDIMEGITFLQPLNSRYLLYLLSKIAAAEKDPYSRKHQKEIVNELLPEISDIVYDKDVKTDKIINIGLANRLVSVFLNSYIYGFKKMPQRIRCYFKR